MTCSGLTNRKQGRPSPLSHVRRRSRVSDGRLRRERAQQHPQVLRTSARPFLQNLTYTTILGDVPVSQPFRLGWYVIAPLALRTTTVPLSHQMGDWGARLRTLRIRYLSHVSLGYPAIRVDSIS